MKQIVKDSDITFNASAKTITLAEKYSALSIAQIIRIRNITASDDIFITGYSNKSITIIEGVITHTGENGYHANTDKILIELDSNIVKINEDQGAILIDGTVSVPAGQPIIATLDIRPDKDMMILVSTPDSYSLEIEITDELIDSPTRWFKLCDSVGSIKAAMTINNKNLAIPLTAKGTKARFTMVNNGAAASTPYLAVV